MGLPPIFDLPRALPDAAVTWALELGLFRSAGKVGTGGGLSGLVALLGLTFPGVTPASFVLAATGAR